jgi:hypothetical protein
MDTITRGPSTRRHSYAVMYAAEIDVQSEEMNRNIFMEFPLTEHLGHTDAVQYRYGTLYACVLFS